MDLRDKNRVLGADNVYETTVQRRACPPLLEDSEAEVLVIGGGLAGLSTALELAALGPRAMLLEAGALCSVRAQPLCRSSPSSRQGRQAAAAAAAQARQAALAAAAAAAPLAQLLVPRLLQPQRRSSPRACWAS